MKAFSLSALAIFALNTVAAGQAVCSSNLLIDDYSRFFSNANALGQYTSDDGSMTNLKADTANKKITFTGSSSGYFYTIFACQATTSQGYSAITFPITGPPGASFLLELQTSATCSSTAYRSYYYPIPTRMTGETVALSIPLTVFAGANLEGIHAIVFESFTSGEWEIGSTEFVCDSSPASTSASVEASTASPSVSRGSFMLSASSSSSISSTMSPLSSISSTTTLAESPVPSTTSSWVMTSNLTSSHSTANSQPPVPPTTSSWMMTSNLTSSHLTANSQPPVPPTTSSWMMTSNLTSSHSTAHSQPPLPSTTNSQPITSTTAQSSSVGRISNNSISSSSTDSASSASCTTILVDDFESQSRLTFLYYNALLLPSSDDSSMKSMVVSNNHLTLTPSEKGFSYFYSMLGCVKATNVYGGIGFTINAPAGTVLGVELQTSVTCSSDNPSYYGISSSELGWTFDGAERYYTIPFFEFDGLDTDHLLVILFTGLSNAITIGPIAFYCGTTGSPYQVQESPTSNAAQPTSTITATVGNSSFVIDTFADPDKNDLGYYHGGDDPATYSFSDGKLTINSNGHAGRSWYTQLSNSCTDITVNDKSYLHISYSGSNAFTIALQQHNPTCSTEFNPYPYTWDSLEAARYSNSEKTDIYIPMSHFHIDRSIVIGFALKGFYTSNPTTVSKIEIIRSPPADFLIPSKLDSAPIKFACTRPNSFAFSIDDGSPEYAQEVISHLKAAHILVTFFTVGAPLLDPSTNLTNVYKQMLADGHQIAYHSFTHPAMEGLPSTAAIDWELAEDIRAVSQTLGITSKYFRPPFGIEGARLRQRLAALIPGAQVINWSVDVQDWLWAEGPTPERQVENFRRDIERGGNLVVCHYLYESTVRYLPEFIRIAKETGKRMMRVDQCLEDPEAPPL